MPPTPLEIANAPGARRGVVVYRPAAQRQVAPTRRTNAPIRGATRASGPVNWDALKAKAMSTEAAQRKQQKAYEEEAEGEAWDALPWYKKGAGAVLGNPLAKAALMPLNVLDTMRKAVVLGMEEVAEHAPPSLTVGTIGAINQAVDTNRTEADTRSNWEKLKPGSDYGFGQLLDPDNPKWVNNIAGFLGDTALDPLTYVSGGANRIAQGAQRGARAAELAEATARASSHLDEVAELAKVGKFEDVGRISNLAAEQEAIARRLTAETAAAGPAWAAPLHQGRKAREAFLGEIAEANPALFERHAAELTKGAERGFNTIKDQALRDAIGLEDPALKLLGVPLPGTRGLVERGAAIGGAARAAANKAPLLGKGMQLFTPQGLEESSKILSRGGEGDALRAATTVRIQNLMRSGAGEMEGRGNKALTDLVRQLRKVGGEEEIRALVRQAETDAEPNIFNKFFGRDLPKLYEQVAGRRMEVSRDPDTYIPHMHTPQGRRFLATLDKDELNDLGFQADDLLEGSKYLEHSRKLTPKKVGEPTEFEIGKRGKITLTTGTIDEINEELAQLFPEFKGKFYQDDPVTIGEAYVSSIARQAGRDRALDRLADSKNPLVREVTGELAESVKARNEFMRRNPAIEKIKQGYTAGQRLVPIQPKGEMPVTPFDDMLATTKHVAESKAARDTVIKEGRTFVDAVREDVSKQRTTLTDTLKGLRDTLKTGLKKDIKGLDEQILKINADLGRMDVAIQKLGPLTSQNLEETIATSVTVDAQMATVRHEIKQIRDRYGKKMPRDQARVEKELQSTLRRLQDQDDKLTSQYAKGTARLREEVKLRREALEAPVRAAKERLDAAEAKVGKRVVSDERVQAANAELRSGFVSEDDFEQERAAYLAALHDMQAKGIPLDKKIDGRLTDETTATVQRKVARGKKAKAVAEAPAAAAPVVEAAAPTPSREQQLTDFFKKAEAAPEPEVAAPVAAVPDQRAALNQAYKDAVANGDEAAADQIEAQLDALEAGGAPGGAPPAPTPAPTVEPNKLVKSGQNVWQSGDGFVLTKNNNNSWHVTTTEGQDFGIFKTKGEATDHIEFMQEMIDTPVGGGAPVEAAATPVATTERHSVTVDRTKKLSDGTNTYFVSDGVDDYTIRKNDDGQWLVRTNDGKAGAKGYRSLKQAEAAINNGDHAATQAATTAAETVAPAVEPVAEAAAEKPLTQRLRYKWTKKDFHGRQIEVGPSSAYFDPVEGVLNDPAAWEIHAYEPVLPRSQWPADVDPVLGQPTSGKRFVATHPKDPGVRGRTFASAREAKQAVQDHLLRQQRSTTMEEYLATTLDRELPVHATYENLSGVREFPERPALSPQEIEANKARAAAAAPKPKPTSEPLQGPRQLTPEGENLVALQPETPIRTVYAKGQEQWQQAYDEWQEMLARSKDPSLTEPERAEAARKARSMGGEFTQKKGKYYSRNAAQKVMIEDIAWQMKRDADPAYAAAQREYIAEVNKADAQVEAMVYTKHHNPITGSDEYTRLPSGSMTGFLEEEGAAERVAVPIEVPTQGEVPTPPAGQLRDPWNTGYSPGQRAGDRAQIEAGSSFVLGPKSYEYDEMRIQAQGITERLDNAARNETELRRLDDAAKAAYSEGVQAADQAVKDAKLAEQRARMDMNPSNFEAGHRPPANAGEIYDEAKRATQRAVDHQTEVRQAWMEADRAWKAKLAERDEYLKVRDQVASLERAISQATNQAYDSVDSLGRDIPGVIDQIRRGETPTLGNQPIKDRDMTHMLQQLQRADIELDEYNRAGFTYMTDVERRNEAGKLVAIDKSMRDLLNQRAEGIVKHAEAILPSKTADQIVRPMSPASGRGIPAAVEGSGQSDLTARAFAESLGPTEPSPTPRTVTEEITRERIIPEGKRTMLPGEEKVLEERLQESPRQAYKPITERQRLVEMEAAAERSDALNAPLHQERARIAGERTEAEDLAAQGRAAVDALGVERDEKLLPLQDRKQTLQHVDDALNHKARLIPQRQQAQADLKTITELRVNKKADQAAIADDIGKVAAQNPKLLDDDLAVVEGLLQDVRKEAQRVNDNDLTAKQVQKLIDKVSQKGDTTVDVMLTTVGKNWKMLYDANGPKRAVLQEGDTILQADLHRMFTNLYEIKKDPVLFGRTLNALTNLFKTYATLSPGFHVRNALSAIFMNATDGVGLKTQLSAARIWREYMNVDDSEAWLKDLTSLHGFSGDEIRKAFAATHGSGAGGRFTEAGFAQGQNTGHWTDMLNRAQRNKVTRLSQRVGERVEGSVRLAMGLDSMRAGDDVEQAIQRINRIHFDYGEISTFDNNMKRVIPFWVFASRNMPMQVSQMWTHPQVYLGYERFVNNFAAEDEELTPEYWTKAGAWNTGLKVPSFVPERFGGGLPIIASPDLGYTRLASDLKDYEDFLSGKRLGGVLSQGNPILTAPIEYATRQDIFTGQKFEDDETVPVGGPLGFPVKMLAGLLGQTSGGEVDAAFMNAVRAVNPWQDRTTRLLPQATGNDPEGVKRQLESWLRFGGAPLRTLTPKQQENEMFRRYYDQLDAQKRDQERQQRRAG